jgi:hypothetical protein
VPALRGQKDGRNGWLEGDVDCFGSVARWSKRGMEAELEVNNQYLTLTDLVKQGFAAPFV